MVAEPGGSLWTVDEYLRMERQSEIKHEYVNGTVYALAGGTRANSLIAGNLSRALGNALEDSPCRVFDADIKIRVSATIYRYPDVAVSCDERDARPEDEGEDAIRFPTVIAEMLSPSTKRRDRTTKFDEYRTIPTLREYVLIEPEHMVVHVYRRAADDTWPVTMYQDGDMMPLESLAVHVPVTALYRKVRLPHQGPDTQAGEQR
jgi:Uma2 family endonuclease